MKMKRGGLIDQAASLFYWVIASLIYSTAQTRSEGKIYPTDT
ncbi:MAG TPA: hypothetical protein VFF70_00400 [Anaerolineae bacterium]|nr:hypothetical protein [Anaerolineae bacterium]